MELAASKLFWAAARALSRDIKVFVVSGGAEECGALSQSSPAELVYLGDTGPGDGVKTRIDSGPGHSGSPFYYYPSGCCGSHYVTGVLAGHVDFWIGTDYTGGPKGSAIRSWVIANM